MHESTRNPFFIKKIEINSLVGGNDIYWELNPDVNVLVGANGTGKSTILKLIKLVLEGEQPHSETEFRAVSSKFSDVRIELNNSKYGTLTCDSDIDAPNSKFKELKELLKKLKTSPLQIEYDKQEVLSKNIDSLLSEFEQIATFSNDKYKPKALFLGGANFINDEGVSTLKENLNIELISTFDMLLLSKEEYDSASGRLYSQLDFLIEKEIKKLTEILLSQNKLASEEYNNKKNTKDLKSILSEKESRFNIFIKEINKLFNANGKIFKLDSKTGRFICTQNKKIIDINDFSSGEKQLLMILLKALNSSDKPTILLMDEPEVSLHMSWQENLIKSIKRIHQQCQIIIVSHSPAVVMQGWLSKLFEIKNITIKG